MLKSGITGRMSSLPQFQMKDGRTTIGRILVDAWSSASTARFASRYRLNQSGAAASTCSPNCTSGQPASAHDTKAIGVSALPPRPKGAELRLLRASITSSAVFLVMLSYVESGSGFDWEKEVK